MSCLFTVYRTLWSQQDVQLHLPLSTLFSSCRTCLKWQNGLSHSPLTKYGQSTPLKYPDVANIIIRTDSPKMTITGKKYRQLAPKSSLSYFFILMGNNRKSLPLVHETETREKLAKTWICPISEYNSDK